MKKQVEKYNAYYYREIETYPRNKFLLIMGVLLLNFGLLVPKGVYSGFSNLNSKLNTLSEVRELNQEIETNLDDIIEIEYLITNDKRIHELKKSVPNSPQTNEYLNTVLNVAQNNQIRIESFSVGSLEGTTLNLSLKTTGNIDDLISFIKDLENSQRLTTVAALRISKERERKSDAVTVDITLSLYKSGQERIE